MTAAGENSVAVMQEAMCAPLLPHTHTRCNSFPRAHLDLLTSQTLIRHAPESLYASMYEYLVHGNMATYARCLPYLHVCIASASYMFVLALDDHHTDPLMRGLSIHVRL